MSKITYIDSGKPVLRDKTKKHLLDFVEVNNCPNDMYLIYEYENIKIFHSESTHATVSLKFE